MTDPKSKSPLLAVAALKKIRARGPLVEKVYSSLKDAIITGRIAPGTWLYEGPITQALGVSRTPLREAFNRLKSDGLIEVIPHRGAFVVELDAKDIDNFLDAREVIETAFFIRAAKGLKREELLQFRQGLKRSHSQLQKQHGPAGRQRALQIYLKVDRDLHDRLIEASGNKFWIKLYCDLRDVTHTIIVANNTMEHNTVWNVMSLTRIPSKKDKPVTTDGPGPTRLDPSGRWGFGPVKDR